MKFLCDVHLSSRVQKFLSQQAHTALHVNDLPGKWDTKDKNICRYADVEECIAITKDAGFVDFYYLKRSPQKLRKINVGNIATIEQINPLSDLLPLLQKLLKRERFLVELDQDGSYTVDQTF